jgi:hypothetical protein
LRLHRGYYLPGCPNRKLSEKRTGLSEVLRKVGRLAYEFNIPLRWKIYPVISIVHLEPAPKVKIPSAKPRPNVREPVNGVEGDSDEWRTYEIERLVNKHATKYWGRPRDGYLVKVKRYSSDWYPIELLQNRGSLSKNTRSGLATTPALRRLKGNLGISPWSTVLRLNITSFL